jgi:hypothetical protein
MTLRVLKVIDAPWFKIIDGTGAFSTASAKLLRNRRFRSNYLGHAQPVESPLASGKHSTRLGTVDLGPTDLPSEKAPLIHIYSNDNKKLTREECEAQGKRYCDKSKPSEPMPAFSGQETYHADIEGSFNAFGVIVVKCCACGIGLTGVPDIPC